VSRLPPELGEQLRPSAEQVEGLVQPLPRAWIQRLATGSRPTTTELVHFREGLHAAPLRSPIQGWQRPALAMALVCALLIGAWFALPGSGGLPAQQTLTLAGAEALELGPTIRAHGDTRLAVVRQDAHHQRVSMGPGRATFEVDPDGPATSLVVLAGEVEVEVKGTAFTVDRTGDRVTVLVHRGLVEVRHRARVRLLGAGDTWQSPEAAAAMRPALLEPAPSHAVAPAVAQGDTARQEPVVPHTAPPVANPSGPAVREPEPATVLPYPPLEPVVTPGSPGLEAELSLESVATAYADIMDLTELGASAARRREATDAFLRAHRDSAFAAEVRALNLEARAELNPTLALLDELDAWLASHPHSPWRLRLMASRARLAHDGLGDCALARPSYEALAAEGGEAWQAWAAEGLVRCRNGR
jgi:hypothetical protein